MFRSYRSMSNSRFGSVTSNTNTKSVLFDVKDPSTMTTPQDVSTKWSKSTVAMATHSMYGVVTVYDNNFGAKEVLFESRKAIQTAFSKVVGSWDVHTHCEWCGQKLDYVAVVLGISTGKPNATVHHIGCDCVGKIFGMRWYGYRNAENVRKTLILAASKRRRAVEYPVKYAKEIAWLDSLPEFLLKKNGFLVDMKKVLRTGERVMSKKMDNYLHALMAKKEYDPKKFATAKLEIDKTLEKLNGILHIVEEVDATEEARSKPWSAYAFVKSIMERFERYHSPLSQKQVDALNRVYVKYRDVRIKKNTNQMKGNPNDIPW